MKRNRKTRVFALIFALLFVIGSIAGFSVTASAHGGNGRWDCGEREWGKDCGEHDWGEDCGEHDWTGFDEFDWGALKESWEDFAGRFEWPECPPCGDDDEGDTCHWPPHCGDDDEGDTWHWPPHCGDDDEGDTWHWPPHCGDDDEGHICPPCLPWPPHCGDDHECKRTVNITVIKIWDDGGCCICEPHCCGEEKEYVHREVTVDLFPNGEAVDTATFGYTHTFCRLPFADEDGEKIAYTVGEIDVPEGYEASYEETCEACGNKVFVITNKKVEPKPEPPKPPVEPDPPKPPVNPDEPKPPIKPGDPEPPYEPTVEPKPPVTPVPPVKPEPPVTPVPPEKTVSPKTGDSANLMNWALISVVSLCGAAFLLSMKKRAR